MDRKKTIFLALIIIVLLVVSVALAMFSVCKVDIYPNGETRVVVWKIKNDNLALNFLKLPANKILSNGDLIVHKNPMIFDQSFRKKENYCSRIIGIPGDIVTIRETKVFVNDEPVEGNYDLWFMYRVSSDKSQHFEKLLESYNCEFLELLSNGKSCHIITTQKESEKIAALEEITNIRKIIEDRDFNSPDMFSSKGNYFLWNKDNMGPVMIPQEEVTVFLNPNNIGVYKYLIQWHEDNMLEYDINKISINNSATDSYTIKQNYYFVLNDNRHNLDDSRTFGFIPENQIVGKVINQ